MIRNHESTTRLVERLFDLFEDPEIGWDAARAVGQVASGGDDVLTKRNHAVIRVCFSIAKREVKRSAWTADIVCAEIL